MTSNSRDILLLLLLYWSIEISMLLVLQIVGAFWYLLSVDRDDDCWQLACKNFDGCNVKYLYCGNAHLDGYDIWQNVSAGVLEQYCSVADDNTEFNFGIYTQALTSGIIASNKFFSKLCYCLWWGLQNLR